MVASHPWVPVNTGLSAHQVDRFLDDQKSYKVYASQKHHRCTVCTTSREMGTTGVGCALNEDNHKMWYRILHCDSKTCGSSCTWQTKVLTCLKTYDLPTPPSSTARNVSNTFYKNEHDSLLVSPPRKKMKLSAKRFVKEKTTLGSKPAHIQADFVDAFRDLPVEELPALSQIQRLSYHHRKTTLLDDALVKHMNQQIEQHQYPQGSGNATTPYAFGYSVDHDGRPSIGRGTNANPTLVGITTRALLGMLRHADTCVLHIDATFKLNESGYPVIIVGISDASRKFHPIAFFITSQLQAVHYEQALHALFDEFKNRTGQDPAIGRIMTDADDALFNALDSVYLSRTGQRPQHLMCFFHVMMNVKKHAKGLSKPEKRLVKDMIYDMHFARDEDEWFELWRAARASWSTSPGLLVFSAYFDKQWVRGRFYRWQCFWSPPGSAKTNNPVEQFNRQVKRDYTLGVLMQLNPLFLQLVKMARTKASYQENVHLGGIPVDDMLARYKYLMKGGLLSVVLPDRSLVAFILEGNTTVVRVFQAGIIDRNIPRPAKKTGVEKFFGRKHNYRQNRFEIRDQPGLGWAVDIVAKTCPCKSFFKFNFCVHLIGALAASHIELPGREKDEVFLNRRIRRNVESEDGVGRPSRVGAALSLT